MAPTTSSSSSLERNPVAVAGLASQLAPNLAAAAALLLLLAAGPAAARRLPGRLGATFDAASPSASLLRDLLEERCAVPLLLAAPCRCLRRTVAAGTCCLLLAPSCNNGLCKDHQC